MRADGDAPAPLSLAEKKELLRLARSTLVQLGHRDPEEPYRNWLAATPPARLLEPGPCFVSLYTGRGRLRGCLGCLESEAPLAQNVHRLTRRAAESDPRFAPVTPAEAAGLSVSLTVLGPLRPLTGPFEATIVPGRHGLVVESGPRRGVLLADVALRYRWSVDEFRRQTCLKAGLDPAESDAYRWRYFAEDAFGESVATP